MTQSYTTSSLKTRKRRKFRPGCEDQAIVYECKKCGYQEEWKMGGST